MGEIFWTIGCICYWFSHDFLLCSNSKKEKSRFSTIKSKRRGLNCDKKGDSNNDNRFFLFFILNFNQSRTDLHCDEIFDIGNAYMNQCSMVIVKFHKRIDPETQKFYFFKKKNLKKRGKGIFAKKKKKKKKK